MLIGKCSCGREYTHFDREFGRREHCRMCGGNYAVPHNPAGPGEPYGLGTVALVVGERAPTAATIVNHYKMTDGRWMHRVEFADGRTADYTSGQLKGIE